MSLILSSVFIPIWLIIGLLVISTILFHAPIGHYIRTRRVERVRQQAGITSPADPLIVPLPTLSIVQVFVSAVAGGSIATMFLFLFVRQYWVFFLTVPCALLCGLGAISYLESKINTAISKQLIQAAAEAAGNMNGGTPLNRSLQLVADQLAEPLATPWRWMTTTAGQSLTDPVTQKTRFVQLKDTARSVAGQTGNVYLARFLANVEAAADMPQQQARDRMIAVSQSLHDAYLAEKSAQSKMTHARVSSYMVVGVGIAMAGFLYAIMPDRFSAAFSSAYGPLVGFILALCFGMPIILIQVLSKVPEMDF